MLNDTRRRDARLSACAFLLDLLEGCLVARSVAAAVADSIRMGFLVLHITIFNFINAGLDCEQSFVECFESLFLDGDLVNVLQNLLIALQITALLQSREL